MDAAAIHPDPNQDAGTSSRSEGTSVVPIALRSLARRALAILAVGGLLAASVVVLGAPAPAEAATHTVTGTVFRDYDGDGILDTGAARTGIQTDVGLGGVTVTATDAAGTSWTATSSAAAATLGQYSMSVVDPVSTKLRISFNTPTGYQPSAHAASGAGVRSNTSVQFIDVASTTTASYAVDVPEDYSQNNPPVVTTIQWAGVRTSTGDASSPTIVSVPWGSSYTLAGGAAPEPDWDTTYPNRTTFATFTQTGSLWPTVYDPKSDSVFAAAVYKRHSGMGPLGIGGIYRVTDSLTAAGAANASATLSNWLDVSTIGINVGTVLADTGSGGRGLGDADDPARDPDAFAKAATVGIGGMAVDNGSL
jgi:hypothetical protein